MKFPKALEKGNRFLSIVSGVLIFAISFLAVIEVISRNIFHNPTIWTADMCYYLLIWAIFLGAGFAFQEHGHVRVDLVLNLMKRRLRRVISAISYCFAIFFCTILGIYCWKFFVQCVSMNRKTYAMLPIPQAILVFSMVLGCVLMVVTLVFIILDIAADGDKYL